MKLDLNYGKKYPCKCVEKEITERVLRCTRITKIVGNHPLYQGHIVKMIICMFHLQQGGLSIQVCICHELHLQTLLFKLPAESENHFHFQICG